MPIPNHALGISVREALIDEKHTPLLFCAALTRILILYEKFRYRLRG